jgi:hypothetical protein
VFGDAQSAVRRMVRERAPDHTATCAHAGEARIGRAVRTGTPIMTEHQYWIGVASQDHVAIASAGGFARIAAAMGRDFAAVFGDELAA